MARIEAWIQESKCDFISDHVFSANLQKTFTEHWHTFSDFKNTDLEVVSKPFRICRISNFLKSKKIMERVKNELLDIKFRRNIIDLYQFEQTGDLSKNASKHIRKLYKSFQKDLTPWMERNMNITLSGKISMSSSSYYDTDYLLCHDDNLEDRRIAFILYLMDEWSVEDGGALDLFDTDEYGLPKNVIRSLVPEYNSFVFFEVVDNSYHQVAEVTSHERCRWSINGWFHGSLREHHQIVRPDKISLIEPNNKEVELDSWISKSYLSSDIIKEVQEQVEENSYSLLRDFFQEDVYKKILADLTSENIHWHMVGPADERHYEIADAETLSQLLKDFYNIFKSITFFRLLKNYTELDLEPVNDNMKPKVTIELQRWSTGCYTLIGNKMSANETTDSTDEELWEACNVSQDDNVDQNDDIDQYEDISQNAEDDKMAFKELCNVEHFQIQRNSIDSEKTATARAPSKVPFEDKLTYTNIIHECINDLKRKHSPIPQFSQSKIDISSKVTKKESSSLEEELSDETSIEDYLSHTSDELSDKVETEESEPGALDLIMQFHTGNATGSDIDYVDPSESEGELIHVPAKENHLCLVYKTSSVCRLHRYVNHYCRGYFYNLICTYYE